MCVYTQTHAHTQCLEQWLTYSKCLSFSCFLSQIRLALAELCNRHSSISNDWLSCAFSLLLSWALLPKLPLLNFCLPILPVLAMKTQFTKSPSYFPIHYTGNQEKS